MRRDIAKVTHERPKSGRTWACKTPRAARVAVDAEGEQADEASNHIRRRRQKTRNQNSGPLKHFLACRVGRPWDRVWSEVCATADPRSTLGVDVRDRVRCLVETDCWLEGRAVMCHSCLGPPVRVRGFYVHPRSGLLLRAGEEQ